MNTAEPLSPDESQPPHAEAAPDARRDAARHDAIGKRLVRNFLHLASGKAAAVGIGMLTLAIMAQMLGPALLGIVAMIESYGRLIDQLLRLETWQAMIRYGAKELENGDRAHLARLIKLGIVTDVAGATVVTATALLGAPVAARILHWDAETLVLAQFYCAALMFGVSSTPVGILRLFDRFAQAAWIEPVIAVVRLTGVALIWATGGSLRSVVMLGIALIICERVVTSWLAWRVVRQEGITGIARARLRGTMAMFPGIAGFVLAANGTVLIRKSTQESDVLVVGAITGATGAGLYQLARKVALAAAKGGQMVQQAAFPDLARLWAAGERKRFTTLVTRIEGATLALALLLPAVVGLAGARLIALIAGPAFEDAYFPLLVQSFAVVAFLSGSALRSALMAAGGQGRMLAISVLAAAGFYATLFPAVHAFGVVGAGMAHIVFNALAVPLCLLTFRQLTSSRQPPSAPGGRHPPAASRG